jgi:hypothetical protein
MKANPGGNQDPNHVYGRTQLIDLLWDRLENQSIVQNGERRIGKTQILRKMLVQPRSGWKPIYRDLEKIHSAQEFAEQVYDDIQQFLGSTQRAKNFIRKFFEDNETDHVNLKARTWKKLLTTAVEELMQAKTAERLVFFWDEIPYMLESICRNDGPKLAAEVLDTLRSLRVEQVKFRVIFAGSLGLHHVLARLTAAGIPIAPINDMFHVTVNPLAIQDAESLAADLIQGEKIPCEDVKASASTIAKEADYFPFYIHLIVAGLRNDELTASDQNIHDFVSRQLVDARDPWQLAHYRKRLDTYYPDNNDSDSVTKILDVLACSAEQTNSLTIDQIMAEATSRGAELHGREKLLSLLRLMDADHYLSRETDGTYQFRSEIIRRWWKVDRGL